MASSQYRIESSSPLRGSVLPQNRSNQIYSDRGLAVAARLKAWPTRQRIRVVHVGTGEVVFETDPIGHEHPT